MKPLWDREASEILRMLSRIEQEDRRAVPRILDVGCGFGRNLSVLVERGFPVIGVDGNKETVSDVRASGYECYLPEESGWRREYDCILMSHVIEHLCPDALVEFIEGYLEHLRPNGHLLIATPLLTDYFFDDFTHIRPYPPGSLMMIFGNHKRQVSIRSRYRLELLDLWFRTSAFRLRSARVCYLSPGRAIAQAVNGALYLAHRLSLGAIGRKDGWVGLFRKSS